MAAPARCRILPPPHRPTTPYPLMLRLNHSPRLQLADDRPPSEVLPHGSVRNLAHRRRGWAHCAPDLADERAPRLLHPRAHDGPPDGGDRWRVVAGILLDRGQRL